MIDAADILLAAAKAIGIALGFLFWDRRVNHWLSKEYVWVHTDNRVTRADLRSGLVLVLIPVILSVWIFLHGQRLPSPSESLFLWCAGLPLLNVTVSGAYNFALNRPQHFLRALMLSGFLLMGRFPALVPLVILCFCLFVPGLTGMLHRSFTDIAMPLASLMIYSVSAGVDASVAKISFCHPATVVSVGAGFYVIPAVAKFWAGWVKINDPDHLSRAAAFQWNWRPERRLWGNDSVGSVRSVRWTNVLVVGLEFVAFVALAGRWPLLFVAAGLICFHSVVAWRTGIIFWEWVVVWVGLSGWAWETGGWPFEVIIAACVIASLVWPIARLPDRLTWFDSPLVHRYIFLGKLAGGTRLFLPPGAFAPFDPVMAQGRLHYLQRRQVLQGCLGSVSSVDAAKALRLASNEDDAAEIKRSRGAVHFADTRSQALGEVLNRFVKFRRHPANFFWTRWLPRIDRLPTGFAPVAFGDFEGLESIEVHYQEALLSHGRETVLLTVDDLVLLSSSEL